MGERGLLQNGEYFIINVDTSDPYDVDKPDKKTKRKIIYLKITNCRI